MEGMEEGSQLVLVEVGPDSLDHLEVLLASLSQDFPVPLLLLLAPGMSPDDVVIRVQGRSTLRMQVAHPGGTPLRAGGVLVLPAERVVEIGGNALTVGEEPGDRASLYTSLAERFGENLIAVLLRSNADLAYEVKQHGGAVALPDPLVRGGLVMAVPPINVDIVAPIDDLGRQVETLLRRQEQAAEPEEEGIQSFLLRLRTRSGIDFSHYKRPTIMRQLQRRMVDTGQNSIDSYLRFLDLHPEEYQRLIGSLLIKVTEFFRDQELFEYLRAHLLPALINAARSRGNELRFWSAGCATGEEAYSLAILMSELLEGRSEPFRVRIFATDLDTEAVEFARRGVYPAAALRNVPRRLIERYFTRVDNEYQVNKRIRTMMVFGHHNLAERAAFPRIDLLLCRNVLIYFTPELQRRVLQIFAFSLRDRGYLVLGKAETVNPVPSFFTPENGRLKVFQRHGARPALPPVKRAGVEAEIAHFTSNHAEQLSVREVRRQHLHPQQRAEALLLRLPVGVIVVNRQYDILTINAAARRMLSLHGTAVGDDLVHLVPDAPPRPLRQAIDAALQGEHAVLEAIPLPERASGEVHYYDLAVDPGPAEGEIDTAVLVVTDVTRRVREGQELAGTLQQREVEVGELRAQLALLTETNRELVTANQEITITNMELRSANEEFLVGNEELQAAAEEVETLNEELQSTNEELEALNEELQATVEELNATNEDLQARTMELQTLAGSLDRQRLAIEAERARLDAVLSSIGDAVLVVGPQGEPVLTNQAYDRLFSPFQPEAIRGEQGETLSPEDTPWGRASRHEAFQMIFTCEEQGQARHFEASGWPIETSQGQHDEVVVIRELATPS